MMICFLLPVLTIQAQKQYVNYNPLNFIENKGQWEKEVIYKSELDGASVFLEKNAFTFLLLNRDDLYQLNEFVHGHSHRGDTIFIPRGGSAPANTPIPPRPTSFPDVRGHAYKVRFLNANPNVAVSPDKQQENLSNYFIGNDPSKWATDVKSFQNINYLNLYPGIDAHVYSEASQLKYDLIVHPGSNPDNIQMKYDGTTGMELKKGQLYIHTTVGDVIEQLPFAYQYINNQRVPVKVTYRLNGDKLGFKVSGEYNPAYTLVIDPVYVFSTVSGSRSDNWGFTATYDEAGNFYGGGIVFGTGYPVTPGAVQSAYGGGRFDIGISKFSSNGTRLIYATYIGGDGLEQPHSLFVDPQGNLVISGRTTSGNYPKAVVEGSRGGWDIAVTKLNAAGNGIIGSLIVAGTSDDGVNMRENREGGDYILLRNYGDDARSEVVVDDAGYIYVASCTRSADFPMRGNGFQTKFGGKQDGVIMKINPLCQALVWTSFIGGSNEDAAYVIALNGLNSLYVAGGTASTDFPVTQGSIYPNYRGGVCDGFIAHITNDGKSIMQATYLGSDNPSADQVYGIQLDKKGFVYVMGTTEGAWPIKLLDPSNYNGNGLQFISKLQPDLSSFVYSTTFGRSRTLVTSPNISPTAFLVDRCENVYVSGWGGGINQALRYPNSGTGGLFVTNDALQKTTDTKDFYFFVMKRDGVSPLYGSYFGGAGLYEHVDGGTSRFDRNGIIYQGICAWCNVDASGSKPRYPTTPGAYSSTPPMSCNFGALKIAFNLDGVKVGIKTLDRRKNYCVPDNITFVDTTGLPGTAYEWHFGDGSQVLKGGPELDTVSHQYTQTGPFTIMVVKFDPNSCNVSDTAYLQIKLGTNRADLEYDAKRMNPPCDSLKYIFTNNSTPAAQFKDSSFILDYGDGTPPFYVGIDTFPLYHYYKAAGTYTTSLTLVDTNFCNAPQTITKQLRVAINVEARFNLPDTICRDTELQLDNTSLGGESFEWTFQDDGSKPTDPYPLHTFKTAGLWKVKLVVHDPNTCNKIDSIEKTILVVNPPTADFEFTPLKPVENTPVQFVNMSQDATQYLWNFGDGDTSSLRDPSHQYLRTGTYHVCLTVTNKAGCTENICKEVSAIVVPLYDVPNAFAPTGKNNMFYVKAFGATKFNMKIYNRWGQMVFESSDPRIGWDGTFKGNLQPMDAYAYVVNLEFTDGTKASKSGSVTLLR
ncbi:PKD domain-containing protein [Chitinophaga silvatica]|uniref:PKD domain-containing protein n=2 Tax=Chitinophaga silvatica TaxID=2282649 RepID=A0A3E1YDP6_9BACT|nr:PKD domain-containing protein [Chitinophaga silvatica]